MSGRTTSRTTSRTTGRTASGRTASGGASSRCTAADRAARIMRLLAFADSALPVGAFSFSNGLETAAAEGLVYDAATLEAFVRDAVVQAAFTDGVAALHAHRARLAGDGGGIAEADRAAFDRRIGREGRRMTCRMGRKLTELASALFADPFVERFLADIAAERTPGTHPAAQGLLFAACGIAERELFCAQQYGVAGTLLNAALRCVRVSHYDTQRILFRLAEACGPLYEEARLLGLDELHAFAPQTEILAALHEEGTHRLFMN